MSAVSTTNVALGLELLIQLGLRLTELANALKTARAEGRDLTDAELQPFADAAGKSLSDLREEIARAKGG